MSDAPDARPPQPCPDCGGRFHPRPTPNWPGRLVCDGCTRIRVVLPPRPASMAPPPPAAGR